ncbi:DNA modification methylase [Thermogemmatispora tikiterensis]|uniref:site-specific DNA-methyltransferase (cytosine-N(4)-specific) n=1 Tax=Thermogemmatispora tikiterensis TaxID=1825093 RepID=A0A328VP50_9CHLR|nr:DNA modification methylase [Thermogemmatispora tikiterensis]
MSLPVHRWFRYPAGFSALWVRQLLQREQSQGRRRVLDPFCGTGTVLLEAEYTGLEALGLEAHPFLVQVARAKLHWRADASLLPRAAAELVAMARELPATVEEVPELLVRCYQPETLQKLIQLQRAWLEQVLVWPAALSELTWLVLAAILRPCSSVGTAQWQYVLPSKTKAQVADPFDAFLARSELMADDMRYWQRQARSGKAEIRQGDARTCEGVPAGWAELVVTSPPYANNYDYADATRLELCFFGEIERWRDLQQAVRCHLIRSCTQHVSNLVKETNSLLADPLLSPLQPELPAVCARLEQERLQHGGRKAYHTMIAAYFLDMARCWQALRRVTATGGLICLVIGDSAPYGVHVPVEEWLGRLALASGFRSWRFEPLRARNVKWQNRKHRVPLHEGLLWVEGATPPVG